MISVTNFIFLLTDSNSLPTQPVVLPFPASRSTLRSGFMDDYSLYKPNPSTDRIRLFPRSGLSFSPSSLEMTDSRLDDLEKRLTSLQEEIRGGLQYLDWRLDRFSHKMRICFAEVVQTQDLEEEQRSDPLLS